MSGERGGGGNYLLNVLSLSWESNLGLPNRKFTLYVKIDDFRNQLYIMMCCFVKEKSISDDMTDTCEAEEVTENDDMEILSHDEHQPDINLRDDQDFKSLEVRVKSCIMTPSYFLYLTV